MKKTKYIIAIDPDCEKSGVAVMVMETKELKLCSLAFPNLLEKLQTVAREFGHDFVDICVEAGWLNESHWHVSNKDSKSVAAAKGNAVGRNHETGRKIIEMAKYYGFNVIEVKPLGKIWGKGSDKISHEEIAAFIPGFPERSNQETRDAALLLWHRAGLPIKISAKKPKELISK